MCVRNNIVCIYISSLKAVMINIIIYNRKYMTAYTSYYATRSQMTGIA